MKILVANPASVKMAGLGGSMRLQWGWFVVGLFGSIGVTGCGDKYGRDCSDVGAVTYTQVAEVFDAHCTRCHSTTLTGGDRNHAPSDVNFDNYDDAKINAPAANGKILDEEMPKDNPGEVSDPEGCLIEAWIGQGYPQ
jgi:uncharacterized membrane protein